MDKTACKQRFLELVSPSLPNDWEIDPIIEEIAVLSDGRRDLLLSQIPVIWPVSHSLCLSFLEQGGRVIESIPAELVPEWVRAILRSYEEEGLHSARRLIDDVRGAFLQPLTRHNLVNFEDISARLRHYLRGMSGYYLELEKGDFAWTDTTTFFLPPSIALLPQGDQNRTLYKFLVTLHWGFQHLGTFRLLPPLTGEGRQTRGGGAPEAGPESPLPAYFSTFADAALAADLFFLLETGRVLAWLRRDLPGLERTVAGLRADLVRALGEEPAGPGAQVSELACRLLCGQDGPISWLSPAEVSAYLDASGPAGVFSRLGSLYRRLADPARPYRRPKLMELLGRHEFARAAAEILRKRAEMREAFLLLYGRFKESLTEAGPEGAAAGTEEDGLALVVAGSGPDREHPPQGPLILDNPGLDLPEELAELVERITDDLGHVPDNYLSAASGAAGHGFRRTTPEPAACGEQAYGGRTLAFDEWDYRRHGYRRKWCLVHEQELPERHSTFVATTLEKHRGLLLRLRRQFEMIKVNEQFVRRQREGDDLDLDAIVEARGDQRAGLSPSSKLFVRLQRNERDLATLFLVDMSNSTEGWVGTVIKEALVLLCEVMEVAGDPYGILGFSGMRRSRCDLFRIKDIEEPYSRLIQTRINSIGPREYTRMGPALRYASRRLGRCEARTRLLVTITDGKPEDYDDYKGEYAIEDTRKALLEARGQGIHTFCITVDREAHDYLPRLFGTGNYVFIDQIDRLPAKMLDMYRLLTSR